MFQDEAPVSWNQYLFELQNWIDYLKYSLFCVQHFGGKQILFKILDRKIVFWKINKRS